MKKTVKNLAAAESKKLIGKPRKDGYFLKIAPKAISQARSDISTWKAALRQANQADSPKRIRLQNLYKDILLDALLNSQIENRKQQTLSSKFSIKDKNGKVNEEVTAQLRQSPWFYDLIRSALDSVFQGPGLCELINDQMGMRVVQIPRNNIEPKSGTLYFNEDDSRGIPYRELKEYGSWVYEFGNPDDFGILNKAIPHVLFKRFAQSCWSELCEIYGVPPRVLKTNTQDPVMLSRGESMMRDMGAAAWFIIDESESFEFAKGTDSKGEVYENLIKLCNNEISLLVSGAIIGQDTKNGNESKETISIEMLQRLVDADKTMIASYLNNKILPGLYLIGVIPDGLIAEFDPQEDISALWNMTSTAMAHIDVDPAWIEEKFGIKVTGKKVKAPASFSFFD